MPRDEDLQEHARRGVGRLRVFSGAGVPAVHWYRRRGWVVSAVGGATALRLEAREMRLDDVLIRTLASSPVTMTRSRVPATSPRRRVLLTTSEEASVLAPTRLRVDTPSTIVLPTDGAFSVRWSSSIQLLEVDLTPKGVEWPRGLRIAPAGAAASAARSLALSLLATTREVRASEIGHLSLAMEFAATAAGTDAAGASVSLSLVQDAESLIRRYAHDPTFSVDVLARTLRLSRRHLTRTLSQTGASPRERIRDVRISLARAAIRLHGERVLRDDTRARAVGFASARALRETLARMETPVPDGAKCPDEERREPSAASRPVGW